MLAKLRLALNLNPIFPSRMQLSAAAVAGSRSRLGSVAVLLAPILGCLLGCLLGCTTCAEAWTLPTISVQNGDVAGLIQAIRTLNAGSGGTITLAANGSYGIASPSDWWYGPNAFPAIASAIVINGNGATISRSGSANFRFFYVSGGFSTLAPGSLTLNGLTLKGGLAQGGNGGNGYFGGGGGAGMGGAIYNQGDLTLNSVTLSGNSAVGGNGGSAGGLSFSTGSFTGGGGGMGGNGGSATQNEEAGSGGGGGFQGSGSVSDLDATYGVQLNPADGGGFLASEGSCGGGTSTWGGNGGVRGSEAGGGGGGYAPGQNGQSQGAVGSLKYGITPGGAGAYAAGNGGNGNVFPNPYFPGLGPCGGAAFGGGGGSTLLGGAGGGGIGGGGGASGGAHGPSYPGLGGFGGGGGAGQGWGGNGGFGGGGGAYENYTGGNYSGGSGGFGGSNGQNCCTPLSQNPANGGDGAGFGGAIFNHLGTVFVIGSNFVSNSALGGATLGNAMGAGGAIFNLNGSVVLENMKESGNSAFNAQGNVVYNLSYDGGNTSSSETSYAVVVLEGTTLSTTNGDLVTNQVNGTSLVTTSTGGTITASTNRLSFGTVGEGTTNNLIVTIGNSGSAALAINSISLPTGTAFSISSNNCPASLAVNTTCKVQVSYFPVTAGAQTSLLTLSSNSLINPNLNIPIIGAATAKLAFASPPPAIAWLGYVGGGSLTVFEENNTGAQIASASDLIQLTVSGPGNATITSTQTAVNGSATFSLAALNLSTPGKYTFTASGISGILPATATESLSGIGVLRASSALPIIVPITVGGTLQQIRLQSPLTAQGSQFRTSSGGTCTVGSAYTAGQTCTVNVFLSPTVTGQLNGGIVLVSSSSAVMGTAFLNGLASGAQIQFGPGMQSSIASGWSVPAGIAIDGSGNLFVADTGNNRIVQVPIQSGTNAFHPPIVIASGLRLPFGTVLDSVGNLFYADTLNNNIVELPWNGARFGRPIGIQSGLPGAWQIPYAVAVDSSGNLYVADTDNSRIVKLPRLPAPDPTTGSSFGPGATIGGFGWQHPTGIAVDSRGNVFVADSMRNTLTEIPNTGSGYGSNIVIPGSYSQIENVAVDNADNLYVADLNAGTVSRIATTGNGWSSPYTLAKGLNSPEGLAVSLKGNVYVTVRGSNQVLQIDLADAPTYTFPTPTTLNHVDTADGPYTVRVFNMGNQPLTFGGSIYYPHDFSLNPADITRCSNKPVPGGSSCDISVNFTPMQINNSIHDTIEVLSNNDSILNVNQIITLQGNGIPPVVAAPVFSPAGGTFTGAKTVTISDSTPGAMILYTTDGSIPQPHGSTTQDYVGKPITVSASETIQAIATAPQYTQSPVSTAVFTIK